MARKFPEALCIDATHGTNCNSFMVTDKFGSGAFVQHALIDGETKLNMKCALKAFKENNTAWRDVKVVIVDKDFTEIDVLAEELPDANVILCHFHVVDYLHRETSKRIYGFTSFEKPHVKNLITLMVRTNDEREFDHYLQGIQALCKEKPAFYDYLTSNWLNCKSCGVHCCVEKSRTWITTQTTGWKPVGVQPRTSLLVTWPWMNV
ncbi:hypothetical protein F442_00318 [Phytophthora nicotianae P10297]|uniref:ZSWIM1/3 RNaseH-like domain-containing protein n=1 Tax=Phytophthora nicotianae P10297 TaxID=1317064 RepID=W3A639_PHYNI|nr:hypothetical protein F442_00318 [Phytophthora nicotianae P10297]